jgi:hypothetical protein
MLKIYLFFFLNLLLNFNYLAKALDRGENPAVSFLTLMEGKDFIIKHMAKRPWEEMWILMQLMPGSKMVTHLPHVQNPTHVGLGIILNRVEDIYIFQDVTMAFPADLNKIKLCSFFNKNPLVKSIRNTIKHNPLLVILTNEPSKNDNKKFINKYCFPNIFEKNKDENKIVVVSVCEDEVENIVVRDGLLNNWTKISFLKHLESKHLLYNIDMGTVLNVLGFPLHSIHYTNEEVVLLYGDQMTCQHQVQQAAQFIIYFNKNLKIRDVNILKKQLCERCLYAKKMVGFADKKRKDMAQKSLAYSGFAGDFNSMFQIMYSRGAFALQKIKIKETLLNFSQAVQWLTSLYNSQKFQHPLSYYQNLLENFFLTTDKISTDDLLTVLDESPYCTSEFYNKSDLEDVKG